MSETASPGENYEAFSFYVDRISDYLATLKTQYVNSPHWTAQESQAISRAFSIINKMTLEPAQYWSAYQQGGWTGLGATIVLNIGSSYLVEGAATWAAASAAAMGMSAGPVFMVGMVAGLTTGVALAYGVDWATGGDLVGSIAGIIDYIDEYTQAQDQPETLPDGAVLLPPLIVTPTQDINVLEQTADLIAQLQGAVETFNNNYSIFGIELDVNDLTRNGYSDWIASFEAALEQTFGSPDVSVTDQEIGLLATLKIAEVIEKLAKLYEQNSEVFDTIKPDFGENIQQAFENINQFVAAVVERISPLILDLNGDGLHTISMLDSDADFDFGDGNTNAHGWLSAEDGFLAVDRNGNGRIDDLSELFGSRDRDGFSILADHDDNMDGVIDAADAIFADLKVWMDIDGDGTSQAGEITGLSAHGITAIRLDARLQDIDDQGNWLPLSGSFLRDDGSFGDIADVYFARLRSNPDQPMDVITSSRVVLGGRHDDRLEGSNIDQIFLGGLGRDVFVWETGQGHDIIADFTAHGPEADIIDLTRTNIRKLEDVRRKLIDTDGDVTLALDDTGSLSLLNIHISDLSAANFMFA